MGRKKKYNTDEELQDAKQKQRMDWYWRNREKVLEESKRKYQDTKNENK